MSVYKYSSSKQTKLPYWCQFKLWCAIQYHLSWIYLWVWWEVPGPNPVSSEFYHLNILHTCDNIIMMCHHGASTSWTWCSTAGNGHRTWCVLRVLWKWHDVSCSDSGSILNFLASTTNFHNVCLLQSTKTCQHYCTESLHMPKHTQTSAMRRANIREILCSTQNSGSLTDTMFWPKINKTLCSIR